MRGNLGQRHHPALRIPHRQPQYLFRRCAVVSLRLHLHPQDAAIAHEIIDVCHTEGRLQSFVQIGDVYTQCPRFLAIDVYL